MSHEDSVPIEREMKIKLNQSEYELLRDELPAFQHEKLQRNFYWDFPDLRLTSQGCTIRLRLTETEAWITRKSNRKLSQDKSAKHALMEVEEFQWPVEYKWATRLADQAKLKQLTHGLSKDWSDFPKAILKLDQLPVTRLFPDSEGANCVDLISKLCPSLFCWGYFENTRRCYELSQDGDSLGASAELDRSSFPNGNLDYELELEAEDPSQSYELLLPILQRLKIDPRIQNQTKTQRLRNYLKNAE